MYEFSKAINISHLIQKKSNVERIEVKVIDQ